MVFIQTLSAQNDSISGIKLIDYYLVNKDINKADIELKAQIARYKNNKQLDSLVDYPYYVGKVSLAKTKKDNAINTAEIFVKELSTNSNNLTTQYKLLLSLADFYDEVSESKKSLNVTEDALRIATQINDIKGDAIGKIRYNVGVSLMSLGEIEKAKPHFFDALKDYESYKKTNPKSLSDANNAVGATMWMSSKLDSAKYYYARAVKSIDLITEGDSIENLYLKTVIKSNISLLEYSQGDFEDAIQTQTQVITDFETVANNYYDDIIVSKAKRFQARAISNLAVFYNDSGNLFKAHEILKYSLEKKKTMQNSGIDIATTLIQIGQSQLSLQNYDEAISSLNEGLQQLENISEKNTYWQAAAFHALAESYSNKSDIAKAKAFYDKSEILFLQTLGNAYDKEFLSFLSNKALFLAKNNEPKKAIETSEKAYNYVLKNSDDNAFQLYKQISNLAETHYLSKNYQGSQEWVQRGYDYLNDKIKSSTSSLDSVALQLNKPKLILLDAKSEYYMSTNKDLAFLKTEIKTLEQALQVLEKRKETIFEAEDISVLLADYKNVTDFTKKLYLELFEQTKDSDHLKKAIELHESSIYNRIRSRLNMKKNVSFSNVPEAVIHREKELKDAMSHALENTDDFNVFLSSNNNWTTFLDSLQLDYPKYYTMRYASIETPLNDLQKNIPEQTTVVRYLYVDNALYAFVVNKTDYTIVALQSDTISEHIATLAGSDLDIDKTSESLFILYQRLWKPLEDNVATTHVIIIPDGELFNLSFETLTATKAVSFEAMADASLLSKHNISYNYSLLLLDENKKTIDYSDDFIAFAPEFNDAMKNDYKLTIKGSLTLDKTYLQLLPQPTSVTLVKDYSKLFNGESFINEKASKQIFSQEANEHKIIHIGTHAESNNISPELSRLVFAKNASNDDNSLYTYEIYNQNLSSNLAVLTACETGKPSYQSGEGMISLAHAFNYAGSESILTSLWKIDEQSSAKIIALFYNNISEGLPKDEALRMAKLDYIKTAEGRTKHPQYWAGLVLIGDASPLSMSKSNTLWIWMLVGLIPLLVLSILFLKQRKA